MGTPVQNHNSPLKKRRNRLLPAFVFYSKTNQPRQYETFTCRHNRPGRCRQSSGMETTLQKRQNTMTLNVEFAAPIPNDVSNQSTSLCVAGSKKSLAQTRKKRRERAIASLTW